MKNQEDRRFHRFLFRMAVIIGVLYALLWFAILNKWEPGDQEAIYRGYKSNRHDAETVEVVEVSTK